VTNDHTLDSLFREAVSAIDSGDVNRLKRLLEDHPSLVRDRLDSPGAWLREQVGSAVESGGFFERPYLLWFIAEDPVRNGKLPGNIAQVADVIIQAAKREGVETLKEQLNYALELVSWSWIARECSVQNGLIDVLVDAGASPDTTHNALVNGNLTAAEHLVKRGAKLTLATALCLGRWEDAAQLARTANDKEKQVALVLSALNGKADALAALIEYGVDLNGYSTDIYTHATALHQAVASGSLEAVKVLVEAGANLETKDKVYHGTPLGWAEHFCQSEHKNEARLQQYLEIAAYLREKSTNKESAESQTDGN
jgi:peptide-methionine (S)-S-oxide reductase